LRRDAGKKKRKKTVVEQKMWIILLVPAVIYILLLASLIDFMVLQEYADRMMKSGSEEKCTAFVDWCKTACGAICVYAYMVLFFALGFLMFYWYRSRSDMTDHQRFVHFFLGIAILLGSILLFHFFMINLYNLSGLQTLISKMAIPDGRRSPECVGAMHRLEQEIGITLKTVQTILNIFCAFSLVHCFLLYLFARNTRLPMQDIEMGPPAGA